MALQQQMLDEILILSPGRKFTVSETGDELVQIINRALESGTRKVLLDFSAVEFIDSMGVGQLVSAYMSTKNKGGRLILCGIQSRVALVLRMANLHLVLDIKDGGPGEVLWD